MNVFLASDLAGHRRGRFLASLLGAEALSQDSLPATGIVLSMGERFQGLSVEDRRTIEEWSYRPGRTLLLVPPYQSGRVSEHLDWIQQFRSGSPPANDHPLAGKVAHEVVFSIQGQDGTAIRADGHQWPDSTFNTRIYKIHSGSGVFAVTCLPLWSISLLEQANEVREWLAHLHELSGKAAEPSKAAISTSDATLVEPGPEDFAVLVCCYAWETAIVGKLRQSAEDVAIPIVDLERLDLGNRIQGLRAMGLLDEEAISEFGVETLRQSPYWLYAVRLKEEVSR